MNRSRVSKAFQTFAEGFALLAEALVEEEPKGFQAPEVEESPREEEPKKVAEKPATERPVSKKVWDEEPPAEKDPEVIELTDLQEAGRQVIKRLGAPALAKVLKANGLKNLSSADPEDYPALYAAIKELTDD